MSGFVAHALCTAVLSLGADESTPLADALAAHGAIVPVNFEAIADGSLHLADLDLLVWDTHTRELPARCLQPEVIDALKTYVSNGGGLLLFSFATAYLHALGYEPDATSTSCASAACSCACA